MVGEGGNDNSGTGGILIGGPGSSASGGSGPSASGGTAPEDRVSQDIDGEEGCDCRSAGGRFSPLTSALAAAMMAIFVLRRRRRPGCH
jgi:MYXO-CTERM domain-containing protein